MLKAVLLIILISIVSFPLFAQNGRTFDVEELSPPKTKVFPAFSYRQIAENLIREDRRLPGDRLPQDVGGQANIIALSDINTPLVSRGFHSFFEGMYAAYADHHPFTLSPDMMWLLISQGFANHVNNNAQQLRSKFVQVDKKQTLAYLSDKDMLVANADWDKVFNDIADQIAGYAGKKLTKTMTANFSTTTANTKIASQITLMNSVQSYFNYKALIHTCGIPKITLEGTTTDWQRVLDKAEKLRQYELDWWIDEMQPVLKQFIETSKGKVDKVFWKNMFEYHTMQPGCGPKQEIVNGWIVKFFPYDKKGERMNLKEINLGRWMPNEILKVDFEYVNVSNRGKEDHTNLELWAGFVGLEQNVKTYGLKPCIGWMVRRKDPLRQVLVNRLTTDNRSAAGVILRVDNVPPELYQIGPIKKLDITFFGNIRIPDEMANISIADMTLAGRTVQAEVERIVKLFPNTALHINGVDYHVSPVN
jgi:hypothetical protein